MGCCGGTDRSAWSYVLMSAEIVPLTLRFWTEKQKMKERKPLAPVSAGQKQPATDATEAVAVVRGVEHSPFGFSASGPPAPNAPPAVTMSSPAQKRARRARTRGRLDRAVLAMLGKGLEDCFDEVRKQEVPERFRLLLQQF
jgi:hypothetical protein